MQNLFALLLGAGLGSVIAYLVFRQLQKAQLQILQGQLENTQTLLQSKDTELAARRDEIEILKSHAKDLQKTQELLAEKFELIGHRLLEESTKKLNDQSQKNLGELINPFKERLKDFETKVENFYSQERMEKGTLKGELNKLMDLNLRMSTDADNLTKALKGDNKAQGNWGEMILESILDSCGLRKGEEYILQGTDMALKNDEGQVIRPDVIINLPEGKHLIVDSKVSLVAYDGYCQSNDPAAQERLAKAHVDSLRAHIKGLSSKKYYSAEQLISPDFVIMFLPIEPAFALAFRADPTIFHEAWEKRVALVSPTTLLTTLKTVATIWKHERQEKNALEIAKRGGALYDKFVSFVQDIEGIGKKVDDLKKAHEGVMGKLSTGQGNLVRQVEMLRELGAKAEKQLPQNLLE
jgi:DNA recombination protein RmuC